MFGICQNFQNFQECLENPSMFRYSKNVQNFKNVQEFKEYLVVQKMKKKSKNDKKFKQCSKI